MSSINHLHSILRHWKQTLLYVLSKPWVIIWWLRKHLAPDLPLLSKTRWGSSWLAYNDFLGAHTFCGTGFEDNEQLFLLSYLQKGMTVIDIGAHHGFYTLLASTKVGSQGQVIAFEPSPRELAKLKTHLSLNKCQNVQVVEVALGAEEGKVNMFVCTEHSGLNSLRLPNADTKATEVEIKQIKLDDYLAEKQINHVDFVKMDVEGGELSVLKGAENILLNKLRPLILYEIQDIRTTPWGYKAVELYQFLKDHDYKSYHVTSNGRLLPCADKKEFDDNLIAVPEEKIPLIEKFIDKTT
jgi:FkbM family methyltransferase